jgi:hypothetical protein
MAQTRNVLLGLEVKPAGKACHCKRNSKHAIAKGQLRFIVHNPGPAAGENGYCEACGRAMIELALAKLGELGHQLSVGTAAPAG